jgi:ligand-binding sensor domain-containing protein/serine phosphatase RsbU (regulator of sigma subunit)
MVQGTGRNVKLTADKKTGITCRFFFYKSTLYRRNTKLAVVNNHKHPHERNITGFILHGFSWLPVLAARISGIAAYAFTGMRIVISLFLFAFFSVCPFLIASEGNWRVVKYGLDQGLSQISVNSLIQDSFGFLWIGTQDGLNKFNGYDFVVYRHQPTDFSSLSNSHIQSVIEDNEGNIWAGTREGLNRFCRNGNNFSVYLFETEISGSNGNNNIYNIFQDRTGLFWLNTGGGLVRFDPGTGNYTVYPYYNQESNAVRGRNYGAIYEDQDQLWIGSKDGLFFFDRENEEFTRYFHNPADRASISNNFVSSIFRTSDGHFLVGTANGLNLLDRENGSFKTFINDDVIGNRERINEINSISEDGKGNVWIGTKGGLFSFNPDEGRFSGLRRKEISLSIADMDVSSVLEDRSENLWLGTLGGLYMLDTKSKFTTYRIGDYMTNPPRAASFIASILPEGESVLWIGTWGGGLFRLNRETGDIVHYSSNSPRKDKRISNDYVHVIYRDTGGRIIIGTRDGLDSYRGGAAGFQPFCFSGKNEECSVFSSNRVYSIIKDSRQVIWVGTGYGLHSFADGRMVSYYHDPLDNESIPSNQAVDIIECREGYIWIATARGLSRFNPETGKFRNYFKDPGMGRFSLSNNELTCLHEDSAGNLWVGSIAGLNRFFRNTGSFIVFSEMEGLPNNLIYSILEDNNGYLWFSTNRGISRFDPASLEITNYDVADGLQSYEFNLGAGHKSASGELFFGGTDGFNAFYPSSIERNEFIPPVEITSFEIYIPGGSMVIGPGNNEIVLRHFENSIGIEFAALDFTRPGRNRYAYMLEGLEDDWNHAGVRRIANYSRIPPGTYTFRVKGSNNDDVWNETGTALKIIIRPAWWQSVFAYIFYSLLLASLIYLLIILSTRRLRSANLMLREKELASSEISRQKEELTLKNKNITDSINYAKRIQVAMMPKSKHFGRLFPESFVYYKSKDIVSGDFYWVNEINDKIFFAVVDCTGHGVPGAFMSIIGYELLRNIINVKGVTRPSEILNILNEDFSGIFDQDEDFSFRDGMDIGFCVIDKKNAILEFAGAFSPLYIIRNNSIIEIRGNRFSVGLMEDTGGEKFENHSIHLRKDDMIYLFSDGYPDQFGGTEGKKFKYRRFRHLLLNIHTLPAGRQMEMLDQSIVQWMGDHEQVDDILIMGVRPGIGE